MTTTCQICDREIKLVRGRIAHHGYRRPQNWHCQTSSCYGARELPYEQSRDAIQGYIRMLNGHLDATRETLEQVKRGYVAVPSLGRSAQMVQPSDRMYGVRRHEHQTHLEYRVINIQRDIDELQARYDAWVAPSREEN